MNIVCFVGVNLELCKPFTEVNCQKSLKVENKWNTWTVHSWQHNYTRLTQNSKPTSCLLCHLSTGLLAVLQICQSHCSTKRCIFVFETPSPCYPLSSHFHFVPVFVKCHPLRTGLPRSFICLSLFSYLLLLLGIILLLAWLVHALDYLVHEDKDFVLFIAISTWHRKYLVY